MGETSFSKLSDDVTLIIFSLLEDDPRYWARLSCVCTRFHSLITSICCKSRCISSLPSLSNDLVSVNDDWGSLYKLAVCCPGLRHSGVLLDNSDFGLHRELGPTEDFLFLKSDTMTSSSSSSSSSSISAPPPPPPPATTTTTTFDEGAHENNNDNDNHEIVGWSLYDDLYFDTVYDNSETSTPVEMTTGVETLDSKFVDTNNEAEAEAEAKRRKVVIINDTNVNNSTNVSRPRRSHLASGIWSLSREQGNKLLASRFRDDCLYISDWPGCIHIEDKRNYMLFRGVFKNFKRTRVWRTINDGNRSKVDLNCAFCSCKETWDMHSAFCLKRGFGFHDDGEPVVRAYVCENGHVSGAWTDVPLYT